jgi:hypothetical protein
MKQSIQSEIAAFIVGAVTLAIPMAQGQPQPQRHLPPPVGQAHHVTGRIEKASCPNSLKGQKLQLKEYWYMLKTHAGDAHDHLVVPGDQSGRVDPLTFTGRPLEQGRLLGEVTLTGDAASFDVQWNESAYSSRVPWTTNVQNGRTGEIITVYRLLTLELKIENFHSSLIPVPEIMFFGMETTKNVGTIKIDCVSLSG